MPEENELNEIIGPGAWVDSFFGKVTTVPEHLGNFGEETANRVLAIGQEKVFRFTVVIVTSGTVENTRDLSDTAPGTGVLVRFSDGSHGILTAAHVLNRRNSTKQSSTVTLLIPPKDRNRRTDIAAIELRPRQCTIVGFNNDSKAGPDIAVIPLASKELRALENSGMVAYNLNKQRWSEEDKKATASGKWWVISIIHGARFMASQILTDYSEERGQLAMMTTNTHVAACGEDSGYDYVELLSEKNEQSYPTHWTRTPPEQAARKIERLIDEGVTRRVWGGASGAGVWNLVVETDEDANPSGRVLVELAGICFFADPDNKSVIAHGTKSIGKIAALHVEAEARRYHGV